MKKNRILLIGFLLATCVMFFPLISLAQETISVPFTAVEEEEQKKGSCCDKKWYLGAEAIYSKIKMDDLNDYIRWVNRNWGGNIDDFDHATGFSIYLDYFFNDIVGMELGYERLDQDVSGSTVAGSFDAETSVDGALVSLVLRRPLGQGNFSVGARIGGGYYWADYEESESGDTWFDWDDSAIGFKGSVNINFCLTDNLSLYASGGYRYLEFDDFDIPLFPNPYNVELDFSGAFASVGLTVGW